MITFLLKYSCAMLIRKIYWNPICLGKIDKPIKMPKLNKNNQGREVQIVELWSNCKIKLYLYVIIIGRITYQSETQIKQYFGNSFMNHPLYLSAHIRFFSLFHTGLAFLWLAKWQPWRFGYWPAYYWFLELWQSMLLS